MKDIINIKSLILEFVRVNVKDIVIMILFSSIIYLRSITIPQLFIHLESRPLNKLIMLILLIFIIFQTFNIIFDKITKKIYLKWEIFILRNLTNYKFNLEENYPNSELNSKFVENLLILLYETNLIWEGLSSSLPLYLITIVIFFKIFKFDKIIFSIFTLGYILIIYLLSKNLHELKNVGIDHLKNRSNLMELFKDQLNNFNTILSFNKYNQELEKLDNLFILYEKSYSKNRLTLHKFISNAIIYATPIFVIISILMIYKVIYNKGKIIIFKQIFSILLFYFLGPFLREVEKLKLFLVHISRVNMALADMNQELNLQKRSNINPQKIVFNQNSNFNLIINNISHRYNNKITFSDLTLNFNFGQIICLSGFIGTGKSTLLKIIFGNERIYKGYISFNGKILDYNNIREWRENIHYCEQFPVLFKRSVLENIKYNDYNCTLTDKLISKFNLDTLILQTKENDNSKVSGGQKQIISIFRLLTLNKPIILIDEPTASLDINYKQIIFEIIKYMKSQNKIVIIATHDKELLKIADKIIPKFN